MSTDNKFRMLHWVFKITSLKKSHAFYTNILGMHVLRHEEFHAGCDAECNGYGDEKNNFVFELTYNYGIKKYTHGNDMQYIGISAEPAQTNAKRHGLEIINRADGRFLIDPDGYRWKLIPEAIPSTVHHVSINVSNLDKAIDFWQGVLGMNVYGDHTRADGDRSALVGYYESQTRIALHDHANLKGAAVDHGQAYGRVAIAIDGGVEPIHKKVQASGDTILHGPIKLDTPGKATVEVIILGDRDGYEICFVGMKEFDELSTTAPGDEVIDWDLRAEHGGL